MALRALGVLALLLFSIHSVKADTYDFDFVSTGSVGDGLPDPVTGGGSFQTAPAGGFPGGSIVTSLIGEMDGQPMTLISGGLNDAGQFSGYAQDQLLFSVDGAIYAIFEGDEPPVAGYQLWAGGTAFPTDIIPIRFDLVDPTDTPEPSTILLLTIGLGLLMICVVRGTKKHSAGYGREAPHVTITT
jgi:hypothetical protein